jgi:hypothetical protein
VISLATGSQSSDFTSHLQRLANLGAGLNESVSPGAALYSPQDPTELADALETLISATLGCTVPLRGTVNVAEACSGTVSLNGVALPCNTPNGWSVDASGRNLTLSGTACATFMNSGAVMVEATFPCGLLVVD